MWQQLVILVILPAVVLAAGSAGNRMKKRKRSPNSGPTTPFGEMKESMLQTLVERPNEKRARESSILRSEKRDSPTPQEFAEHVWDIASEGILGVLSQAAALPSPGAAAGTSSGAGTLLAPPTTGRHTRPHSPIAPSPTGSERQRGIVAIAAIEAHREEVRKEKEKKASNVQSTSTSTSTSTLQVPGRDLKISITIPGSTTHYMSLTSAVSRDGSTSAHSAFLPKTPIVSSTSPMSTSKKTSSPNVHSSGLPSGGSSPAPPPIRLADFRVVTPIITDEGRRFVLLVQHIKSGTFYVMKVFLLNNNVDNLLSIYREYTSHIYLRDNPRVVPMHFGWREGQVLVMALEFMPGGTFFKKTIDLETFMEVIACVHSLHLVGFAHGDAHSDNMFKGRNRRVQIGDLEYINTDYAFQKLTDKENEDEAFLAKLREEFYSQTQNDYALLAEELEEGYVQINPPPTPDFIDKLRNTRNDNIDDLVNHVYFNGLEFDEILERGSGDRSPMTPDTYTASVNAMIAEMGGDVNQKFENFGISGEIDPDRFKGVLGAQYLQMATTGFKTFIKNP